MLNIRVAAWIEHEGKILAVTFPDGNKSLPGGRVKLGETTEAAICREIKEETGHELTSIRLISVIENFFAYDNTQFHEFLYVYNGTLSDLNVSTTNEQEQIYSWIRKEQLNQLKPIALQQIATQNPTSFSHIINQK